MPSDPLAVFKTTYAQGVANGLTTGAAQLAAQAAMDAVLRQQNAKSSTVAVSVQPVRSGRVVDQGPKMPPKRTR